MTLYPAILTEARLGLPAGTPVLVAWSAAKALIFTPTEDNGPWYVGSIPLPETWPDVRAMFTLT